MSQRPDVSIQVLPFSVGAHSAMAGPFVHLEFPAENDPDVIFVENTLGDTLFRDDEDITARVPGAVLGPGGHGHGAETPSRRSRAPAET